MTQHELSGIIGAALTPFSGSGKFDSDSLATQLDFLVQHCDAVSLAGAEASEYSGLTAAERRRFLREAIAIVDGRIPVLAGASSPVMAEVAELAELATGAGVQYLQVLMPRRPWGGEPSTSELVSYYEAVTEHVSLPVLAYHNPVRGADPGPEAYLAISEIDGIFAFKESGRNINKISLLIEEIQVAGRALYFTTMQPLLHTLMLGGAGALTPSPASLIAAKVVGAFRAGDYEKAAEWQRALSVFPSKWASYGLGPVMRSALKHLGVDMGDPTSPFHAVSPQDDAAIGEFLAKTVGSPVDATV